MREIEHDVVLLKEGWDERIEFRVCVGGEFEIRVNTVRMAGLLDQLRNYSRDGDPGPASGAQRGSPNKAGSRPPGRVGGFVLLDEITCEAAYWLDRILTVTGQDRTQGLKAMPGLLDAIVLECQRIEDTNPGLVADVACVTREWVRRARFLLAHEPGTAMFAGTVCGDCGGALAVSRDAASATSVRCIGGPAVAGCGRRYERGQWLDLYRAGESRNAAR